MTFEDLNNSDIVDEWASYLKSTARKMMSQNGELISYSTATGYMSDFKCSLVDKYHSVGVPTQFESQIWSRMLSKIRQAKFADAQKNNKQMSGFKVAVSQEDKRGLVALVVWKGSLENAEFMMLFNSMTHDCGRGFEIAVLLWTPCELEKI